MTEDRDPLLTQREAAEYLRYGVRTLQRWRREGIGPPSIKLPNGQRRYRRSALDAWLAEYGDRPEG
jgi:excisionase family DNA binding protein